MRCLVTIQEDAEEAGRRRFSGRVLANTIEMDDSFQFGEPGEVKKVRILIEYSNMETTKYKCCSGAQSSENCGAVLSLAY